MARNQELEGEVASLKVGVVVDPVYPSSLITVNDCGHVDRDAASFAGGCDRRRERRAFLALRDPGVVVSIGASQRSLRDSVAVVAVVVAFACDGGDILLVRLFVRLFVCLFVCSLIHLVDG
jgi:hypothetical protein